MMFEMKRLPSIFSILHMCEGRLVFEASLIMSTVSFRAKAINLVSVPPFATYFFWFDIQRSVNHLASNYIFKSLLARPFSLREREYSVGYQGNAVRKRIHDK